MNVFDGLIFEQQVKVAILYKYISTFILSRKDKVKKCIN